MPLKIIQRARGFTPNLYFNVPFKVMLEYQVRRGSKLICTFNKVYEEAGGSAREVGVDVTCNVEVRDGRFYLPSDTVRILNLTGTEYCEIIVQKLIKPDGEEVELYPGEEVEVKLAPKPA
ncbi:MAG: hypothetical protein QXK12_00045 [Candidatus Nezhaarchaeales archaeon]